MSNNIKHEPLFEEAVGIGAAEIGKVDLSTGHRHLDRRHAR